MALIDDLAVSLDDHLAGPEPDWDQPAPLRGADDADRYGRWLNNLTAQADAVDELADAEIARNEAWRAAQTARLDTKRAVLVTQLEQWHRAVLADDPARKTIVLPSITLRSRAAQPEWQWTDDTAFLAWAAEHRATLVHTPEPKPRPAKTDAKKLLIVTDGDPGETVPVIDPGTGETVPGVTAVIRDHTFTITATEVDQ